MSDDSIRSKKDDVAARRAIGLASFGAVACAFATAVAAVTSSRTLTGLLAIIAIVAVTVRGGGNASRLEKKMRSAVLGLVALSLIVVVFRTDPWWWRSLTD